MFSPYGVLKDMPLFPTSQRRYMSTQTKYFIINLTFIEWLMPCEDKVDSVTCVLIPAEEIMPRAHWQNLIPLERMAVTWWGAERVLVLKVSLEWLSLPHCEHSLAFMYFGRTKRWGKPAKIWTCVSGNLLVGQLLQM